MIDAGRARSLAIMAEKRNPQFPNVPTIGEELGTVYATGAWRGIAGPKNLPADIQAKLGSALKKVYDSAGYKEFMTNRGFGMTWADGLASATFMDEGDAKMGDRHEERRPGQDLTAPGPPRSVLGFRCSPDGRLWSPPSGRPRPMAAIMLPPVPGQQVGPNVFPMVIGIGLVACGVMIAAGIGRILRGRGRGRSRRDRGPRAARRFAAAVARRRRSGPRPMRLKPRCCPPLRRSSSSTPSAVELRSAFVADIAGVIDRTSSGLLAFGAAAGRLLPVPLRRP